MDTQADIIKRGFITGANGEQLALGSQQATNFLLNQGASIAQPKMNAGTSPSSTIIPQAKDFVTIPKDTTPSDALIGGTSVKDILAKRAQLESDFVNASKPSDIETDLTSQLNTAKQLSRKAQLAFLDESRRIQEASGGTKAGASEFLSDVSRRYADESARQGIGLSGLADALTAEVARRTTTTDGITKQMQFSKDNIALLQDLQKMTMPNLVGSPQVNEMTGEVTVFQQDPQTGRIVSSVVGNVGASKKYIQSGTYQDASGNQVFWGLGADGKIETKSLGGGKGVNGGDPMAVASDLFEKVGQVSDVLNNPAIKSVVGTSFLSRAAGGTSGVLGRFGAGAAAGGLAGSFLGPVGAAVGALVGGTALASQGVSDKLTGKRQSFVAGVEQLVSQEFLDSLISAKAKGATFGALTLPEQQALTQAATKIGTWRITDDKGRVLGYNASESDVKKELQTIQDSARKVIESSLGLTAEEIAAMEQALNQ